MALRLRMASPHVDADHEVKIAKASTTDAESRYASRLYDAMRAQKNFDLDEWARVYSEKGSAAAYAQIPEEAFQAAAYRYSEPHLFARLTGIGGDEAAKLGMSFDTTNYRVFGVINDQTGRMIADISTAQRTAIQNIIADASMFGGNPRDIALQVQNAVGLHERYANAVSNLDRRLIEEGASFADRQRLVGAYHDKLLRSRALTIARTETMFAQNQGRFLAWEQAIDGGVVSRKAVKTWSAAPGACDICDPLHGQTVGWNNNFDLDISIKLFGSKPISMPPAHPNCRCTAVLRDPDADPDPGDRGGLPMDMLSAAEATSSAMGNLLQRYGTIGLALWATPGIPFPTVGPLDVLVWRVIAQRILPKVRRLWNAGQELTEPVQIRPAVTPATVSHREIPTRAEEIQFLRTRFRDGLQRRKFTARERELVESLRHGLDRVVNGVLRRGRHAEGRRIFSPAEMADTIRRIDDMMLKADEVGEPIRLFIPGLARHGERPLRVGERVTERGFLHGLLRRDEAVDVARMEAEVHGRIPVISEIEVPQEQKILWQNLDDAAKQRLLADGVDYRDWLMLDRNLELRVARTYADETGVLHIVYRFFDPDAPPRSLHPVLDQPQRALPDQPDEILHTVDDYVRTATGEAPYRTPSHVIEEILAEDTFGHRRGLAWARGVSRPGDEIAITRATSEDTLILLDMIENHPEMLMANPKLFNHLSQSLKAVIHEHVHQIGPRRIDTATPGALALEEGMVESMAQDFYTRLLNNMGVDTSKLPMDAIKWDTGYGDEVAHLQSFAEKLGLSRQDWVWRLKTETSSHADRVASITDDILVATGVSFEDVPTAVLERARQRVGNHFVALQRGGEPDIDRLFSEVEDIVVGPRPTGPQPPASALGRAGRGAVRVDDGPSPGRIEIGPALKGQDPPSRLDRHEKTVPKDRPREQFDISESEEWERRWTQADPEIANVPDWVREGGSAYAAKHGFRDPHLISYSDVMQDKERSRRIAAAYEELDEFSDDIEVTMSYTAFASEVRQQYEHLTKTMGVRVEVVDVDPYESIADMVEDLFNNKRLKVLSTKSTGSHPFLTDAENDMFRAVHDFFGHAATGRPFDRHGEDAAWLAHAQMFSDDARRALTIETRGQNAALIWTGEFPPQKVNLLPREFSELPDLPGVSDIARIDDDLIAVGPVRFTDDATAEAREIFGESVQTRVGMSGETRNAAFAYQVGDAFDLNAMLRGQRVHHSEKIPELEDIGRKLDALIDSDEYRVPSRGMVVHRGVRDEVLDAIDPEKRRVDAPETLVGKDFDDPGFGSTTADVSTADEYARIQATPYFGRQAVVMDVELPGGEKVAFLGGGHDEILLPRGVRYVITDARHDNDILRITVRAEFPEGRPRALLDVPEEQVEVPPIATAPASRALPVFARTDPVEDVWYRIGGDEYTELTAPLREGAAPQMSGQRGTGIASGQYAYRTKEALLREHPDFPEAAIVEVPVARRPVVLRTESDARKFQDASRDMMAFAEAIERGEREIRIGIFTDRTESVDAWARKAAITMFGNVRDGEKLLDFDEIAARLVDAAETWQRHKQVHPMNIFLSRLGYDGIEYVGDARRFGESGTYGNVKLIPITTEGQIAGSVRRQGRGVAVERPLFDVPRDEDGDIIEFLDEGVYSTDEGWSLARISESVWTQPTEFEEVEEIFGEAVEQVVSRIEGYLAEGHIVNHFLRRGKIRMSSLSEAEIHDIVSTMDIATVVNTADDNYRLYRGSFFPERSIDRLKVGETWSDDGFWSTTLDVDQAKEFMEGYVRPIPGGAQPVLMNVLLRRGQKGFPMGAAHAEIVLPRGQTYRIVDIGLTRNRYSEFDPDEVIGTYTEITVEVVDDITDARPLLDVPERLPSPDIPEANTPITQLAEIRQTATPGPVSRLMEQLDYRGQDEPVVIHVTRDLKRAALVDGNHRLLAAERLGWETLRTRIRIVREIDGSAFPTPAWLRERIDVPAVEVPDRPPGRYGLETWEDVREFEDDNYAVIDGFIDFDHTDDADIQEFFDIRGIKSLQETEVFSRSTQQHLVNYQAGDYGWNLALRGASLDYARVLPEEVVAARKLADEAFDQAPTLPRGLVLYRGTSMRSLRFNVPEAGDTITDAGVLSTSGSKVFALDAAGIHANAENAIPVVYRIRAPEGTRGIWIGNDMAQNEVLLDRGMTLRVRQVTEMEAEGFELNANSHLEEGDLYYLIDADLEPRVPEVPDQALFDVPEDVERPLYFEADYAEDEWVAAGEARMWLRRVFAGLDEDDIDTPVRDTRYAYEGAFTAKGQDGIRFIRTGWSGLTTENRAIVELLSNGSLTGRMNGELRREMRHEIAELRGEIPQLESVPDGEVIEYMVKRWIRTMDDALDDEAAALPFAMQVTRGAFIAIDELEAVLGKQLREATTRLDPLVGKVRAARSFQATTVVEDLAEWFLASVNRPRVPGKDFWPVKINVTLPKGQKAVWLDNDVGEILLPRGTAMEITDARWTLRKDLQPTDRGQYLIELDARIVDSPADAHLFDVPEIEGPRRTDLSEWYREHPEEFRRFEPTDEEVAEVVAALRARARSLPDVSDDRPAIAAIRFQGRKGSVKLDGVDTGARKAMLSVLDRFAQRYPRAMASVEGFVEGTTTKGRAEMTTEAIGGGSIVKVRTASFSVEGLKDTVKKWYTVWGRTGEMPGRFHIDTVVEYFTQHELGHVLFNYVGTLFPRGKKQAKNPVILFLEKYIQQFAREGEINFARDDIALLRILERELSAYPATRGPHVWTEIVAESFAEVQMAERLGVEARPFATGVVRYIEGLIESEEARERAPILAKRLTEGTGFSVRVIGDIDATKPGYMTGGLGIEDDFSTVGMSREEIVARLLEFQLRHSARLADEGTYFGAWMTGGRAYLDVSERIVDKDTAIRTGLDREQFALYDLTTEDDLVLTPYLDDKGIWHPVTDEDVLRIRRERGLATPEGPDDVVDGDLFDVPEEPVRRTVHRPDGVEIDLSAPLPDPPPSVTLAQRPAPTLRDLPPAVRKKLLANFKAGGRGRREGMDYSAIKRHTRKLYEDALKKLPKEELEYARNWYRVEAQAIRDLMEQARISGVPVTDESGYALAALMSPQTAWDDNGLRYTTSDAMTNLGKVRAVLQTWRNGDQFITITEADALEWGSKRGMVNAAAYNGKDPAFASRVGDSFIGRFRIRDLPADVVTTYLRSMRALGAPQAAKALRLLRGEEFQSVFGVGSPKTASFAHHFADLDRSDIATVDVHMIRAMLDDLEAEKKVDWFAKSPRVLDDWAELGFYPIFAEILREIADAKGVTTHQVQSIVWIWWRNYVSKTK